MVSPVSYSAAGSPDLGEFQQFFDKERDNFLLHLRDCKWRPLAEMASWLAPRLSVELAINRFLAAGGLQDVHYSRKIKEGQALFLHDFVTALQSENLLAVRTEAGVEEIQATSLRDERFSIDPDLERLLPRSPDEVASLEALLLKENPRDPLVVWKGHQLLVDGHTRWPLYSLLGRKFEVVEMEFVDRDAVKTWMYDVHYGRRNFSAEMKAYVRGKHYNDCKQKHGGARDASYRSGNLKTVKIVANRYKVGTTTISRDGEFAEALDKIATISGDEVRQKVLSRAVRWTKQDVVRLGKLDDGMVREIVALAIKSGKRPRFPKESSRKSVQLTLRLGKPVDQYRVLKEKLGGKGLRLLYKTLRRRFRKKKRARV